MMKRWSILVIVFCLLVLPLSAQDSDPTPYEIALERIHEAQENGATELRLSGLNLTDVPPEIGQLSNLTYLRLDHNELTEIPPEIGQLSNLAFLRLDHNELTELPPEIGQLSNLDSVWLSFNSLSEVPFEITELSNLQNLWLSSNQLTELPAEIAKLSHLRVLLVANNHITELPSEIGQLSNLKCLDISRNQIEYLPTSLSHLNNLTSGKCPFYDRQWNLYVNDNPLVSPPPEVVAQGTEAILDYLENEAWRQTQRMIISIAAGFGLLALFMRGFRYKQGTSRKPKQKRQ